MLLKEYESKESYILPNDRAWWGRHPNILVIESYKDFIKGKVADIGCNNGMCTSFIPTICTRVHQVVGVDINEKALTAGRELIKTLCLQDKITFNKSSIIKLPFVDGELSSILCFHTLEHIYGCDLNSVVLEMLRCLEVGGFAVITVPLGTSHWDVNHVSLFDVKTLEALFTSNNFKSVEVFEDKRSCVSGLITGLFVK